MPKAAERHWTDYLPEAGNRLQSARNTYGEIGARCEDEAGAVVDPPDIDMQDPRILEAITSAVGRERTAATTREAGLRQNRDDILAEKKTWTEFGEAHGDPEAIQTKLARLAELETAASAAKAGSSTEEFEAEVERVAQAKYLSSVQEQSRVMEAKDTLIKDQGTKITDLEKANHRAFVAESLLRAIMPDDSRFVQEGAEHHLINTLSGFVVPHKVDGLPYPVARLQVDGALVPGQGPDQLMDFGELLPLIRQGKGPLPVNLSYCFVSGAKGSGTTTPQKQSAAGGNWWKMGEAAQDAYIRENGAAAASALIDSSGPKPAAN